MITDNDGDAPENLIEEDLQTPPIAIDVDITPAVNYACWQNSVPFLRGLRVVNNTEEPQARLKLELISSPAFLKPKIWTLDRIPPGEDLPISDRLVQLDPEYLAGLNEAERGIATLRLIGNDGSVLAEQLTNVRLLARDEWGGFSSMASISAAFVMPNDPAVAGLLKDAAKVLADHGHSSALDGYQTGDPRRAYMLGAAIWSSVAARGLTYAEPPKSFEKTGQKVRRPQVLLEQGLATCFDLSLLFASALEAAGLNPFLVLLDGHSFTGFWLVKKTFPNLLESDPAEIRKALAAREVVTFETTCITQIPPVTFDAAVAIARNQTSEQEEDRFVTVIDIARARATQIRPLASHQRANGATSAESEHQNAALPLPALPDFDVLPADQAEEKPSTPTGRIERWQRKLLDLSLRNRLLNFRPTKQTVPFLCPNVPLLEDRLADQARIKIISLPEQNPQGERDSAIHLQSTGKDLDAEFALNALQKDELASPLEPKELSARLTELYRRAKSDLNEGGSNTLFLAVGFLRWKKAPEDERSYRAPLLLVPVKLDRRSATSSFRLLHHEDEARFNATLIQMLAKDFDLDIGRLEAALPRDESGIDVPMVLGTVRRTVRDVPGFEVVDETALSTFSFAKYLMWKDLVDRTDSLRNNRVVRHLIDNPDQVFKPSVSTSFPSPAEVDVRYHPKDIFNPLPADSSQLAATMAAAEGQDFVLIGPPGTGKSQTITNMIAQCLVSGKSVLFVAEKTAALGVVHRRLRENDLGTYCLELHSNKAERKAFLSQIQASWNAGTSAIAEDWIELNDQLCIKRDELNTYVAALHNSAASGWSPFDALGCVVNGKYSYAPELDWEASLDPDETKLKAARQLIEDLALTRRAVRDVPALALIRANEWSVRWQSELIAACREFRSKTLELVREVSNFRSIAGLPQDLSLAFSGVRDLAALATELINTRDIDLSIVFEQQFEELKGAVFDLDEAINRLADAYDALSGAYSQGVIPRIPVDDLERQWLAASAALWPKSALEQRKTRKMLQGYARGGEVDPDQDLPLLRTMQGLISDIDKSPLRDEVPGWNGAETDTAMLLDHFGKAAAIRDALSRVGKLIEDFDQVANALGPAIKSAQSDASIVRQAEGLRIAMETFLKAAKQYGQLGGTFPPDRTNSDYMSDLAAILNEIIENETGLQAWTEWCALTEKARSNGLTVFADALEQGNLKPDDLSAAFELAYARWWLPKAIDRDPILRKFKGFRHEDTLKQFRELDDKAQAYAAAQVRQALRHDLPRPQEVPRRSELGLLRHQMELQRPSKSIREMIKAIPESFGKLAPCLLMSPLSIAQYLPADQALFDVVIFDEASQITTWDAVGSIARGQQTIIVGDPKQLPPTNFFGRSDGGDDAPEIDFYERDLDSILDEAKASGMPVLQLDWHYRSRHESLIAFSNWHYYQNRLITFPSPVTEDRAVRLEHVAHGVYDRGKSRTNRGEARAIVRDATKRMMGWLRLPEEDRPTLGVITFNSQQRSLIDDLFDEARRASPELEWFFSDERIEPTMAWNLENVQGDERDVMMFTITYGPDHAGKVTMDFGAINRDGGERRLNVAITRAREELIVYSTLTADDIVIERAKGRGVQHLKAFLDYAERGPIALPAQDEGSVGGFDSPFEEAVATAIENAGWTVVPQIGVSGFRIDLGIVHPDKPGSFLAGIECDGATYHRAATAKDRDKVREAVLRGLGWTILRIWSPDWWYDEKTVLDRLLGELDHLLEASRSEAAMRKANEETAARNAESTVSVDRRPDSEVKDPAPADSDVTSQTGTNIAVLAEWTPDTEVHEDQFPSTERIATNMSAAPAGASEQHDSKVFQPADLSDFKVEPEEFFEIGYRNTLREMVVAVVNAEAPVREDVLAQRIARAHGWQRTGSRIRDQVSRHLKNFESTEEATGRFIWRKDSVQTSIPYRTSKPGDDLRPVAEISMAELTGFVLANPDILDEDDPPLTFARLIGLERLARASRLRLEDAVAKALKDIVKYQ